MSTKVSVLAAVIAVSIGALAFKGVDIAQAFADVNDTPAVEPTPETTLTEGAGEGEEAPPADAAAAGAPSPEQCLTTLNAAAEEMGLSSQEIVVLRSLQSRREALDARETGIGTREAATAAAESRLQEQIAELKAVEANVQKLLGQMDAKADERMATLVKSYESMKPKNAAEIFNAMDDKLLTDIAKSMKPATLAAVMSAMQPKRAEALTRLLADLARAPAVMPTSATPPPATTTPSPT